MDNYIVRIYRKDAKNPHQIAGVVEIAGTDKTVKFTNFDELSDILTTFDIKRQNLVQTGHRKKGDASLRKNICQK